MHMSKGTADDVIVLSSEEDVGIVVKPAKKSKAKLATLKVMMLNKGTLKYVVPVNNSSDNEAGPAFIVTCMADVAPPWMMVQ